MAVRGEAGEGGCGCAGVLSWGSAGNGFWLTCTPPCRRVYSENSGDVGEGMEVAL